MTTPTRRRKAGANLLIYEDSRRPSRCRRCGVPVEWATLAVSGKRMPFNPPIQPVASQPDFFGAGQRTLQVVDTRITATHVATCPHAAEHRRT